MTMPWTLARQTARDAVKPLEAVEVPLPDALGSALASGVNAHTHQPTCDTSAMDGYAVAGLGPWTVVGRVSAGDRVPPPLRFSEACAVATGAPVPAGADLVVPIEHCHLDGELLTGYTGELGKHVRRRGEDWSAGDELVPAGTVVSPAVLGLAAGAGHDTLLVHRKPRVAVVVTGDELLRSGPPRPGRVRDAIGPMLPGLLTGSDLLGTTHLRDDPEALADALTCDAADVLVACGATSVGAKDHLRRVLVELDAEVLVSGVACRPGHPQLLAALPDGRVVVGLPGNPFAALAAVVTLLQPLLGTLSGRTVQPAITARFAAVGHRTDTRLIPVTRHGTGALPVGRDRPGSLWGAALADALAVVPPGHFEGEVELLALTSGNAS
ncbi:hypothetical protein BBK82_43425 [Lentzea guizhouensis]|uniref:Molybdopterin molybdenumtransferase n=1 Tax=Lentzea guizhouensis TaxID=1586287 RepID=A0A1B2HVQ2_9PSEU|nr:molybdopterin molybdotransferase MoeA [Lentzea guizhouensis]ANZ41778.1 hypothetical protein BBK82_43425 [Lentzea guizhouensis]